MYRGLIPEAKFAGNFKEGNKILKIYENKDVNLRLADTPDEIGYMKAMGQKASVRIMDGEFDITFINTEFNRISAMEEAIHYQQYKKYGEEYVSEHLFELEVEAQNTLLRIGKKEGWSKSEMSELEAAKKTWEKLAKKK